MFKYFMPGFFLLIILMAQAFGENDAVIKAQKSVVRIVSMNKKDKIEVGTGFVVDAQKHIITNFHVVRDSDAVIITDDGVGELNIKQATIIAKSPSLDLAILDVPTLNERPPLPIFEGKLLKETQNVWAIGFPDLNDEENDSKRLSENNFISSTITEGTINKITKTIDWGKSLNKGTNELDDDIPSVNILHHSANTNQGNSGGPLVNECGEVVGVNTVIKSSGSDQAANPVNSALNVVDLSKFLSKNSIKFVEGYGGCMPDVNSVSSTSTSSEKTIVTSPDVNSLSPDSTHTVEPEKFSRLTLAALGLVGLALAGLAILFLYKPEPPGDSNEVSKLAGVAPLTPRLDTGYCLKGLDGYENLHFVLDKDSVHIGRSASMNDYAIPDDSVSRRHISLHREQDHWLLEDENSSNGTSINGQQLVSRRTHRLATNDIVKIGEVKFLFCKT